VIARVKLLVGGLAPVKFGIEQEQFANFGQE
jgi:hypothetical protein